MNILTKTFIVLQLVFSIGLAVMIVLTIGEQNEYKSQVAGEHKARVAAVAAAQDASAKLALAETNLNEAKKDRSNDVAKLSADLERRTNDLNSAKTRQDTLEAQLADATANNTRLTNTIAAVRDQLAARDTDLKDLRPQVADFVKKNAELTRAIDQLSNEKELNVKAIKTLQEEIAVMKRAESAPKTQAAAGGAAVSQLSAGTPTAVQINGKIQKVQDLNGRTFVTLSLGGRDGVQQGNRFTIYRNNEYVGDAVVQRVVPDQAIAEVTVTRKAVQANDLVISGGGM